MASTTTSPPSPSCAWVCELILGAGASGFDEHLPMLDMVFGIDPLSVHVDNKLKEQLDNASKHFNAVMSVRGGPPPAQLTVARNAVLRSVLNLQDAFVMQKQLMIVKG